MREQDTTTSNGGQTINCPKCKTKISDASIAAHFGRIGGQQPKHYSEQEKEKRRERMAAARSKRWEKRDTKGRANQ